MVSIKVSGKEYKKEAPLVKDWQDYLGRVDETKGKNMLIDPDMYQLAIKTVTGYLNIPSDASFDEVPFEDLMTAYQQIQADIVQSLNKAAKVWGNVVTAGGNEPPMNQDVPS